MIEKESLVYTAKEVMKMLNCCESSAYKIIKKINMNLAKERKIKSTVFMSGRVNRIEFDKIYR